jgi:hypothetical protein
MSDQLPKRVMVVMMAMITTLIPAPNNIAYHTK